MTVVVDVIDAAGLVAGHEAVRRLVEAVLDAEGLSGEVAVAFLDERAIADLNGRYRNADGTTDVLSFDYSADVGWPGGQALDEVRADSPAPPEGRSVTGEIVVCPQVVVRYAAEEGRDPLVQLGWTLIHGALHLAGYDHEIDQGEMRAREQDLLRQLSVQVQALTLEKSEA